VRGFLRPLIVPLVLVGILAGTLGFFVTRSIVGDRAEKPAQVSVVALPATPTPSPSPEPSPSPSADSSSRGRSSRNPNCPSGCECSFPPGGTVVVCRGGGSVTIP
jgi:hypothetical protein